MNQKSTYALLVVFFAGLVGLWALDFARVPTRKDRERWDTRILPTLLDTRPDDLRKIEIEGGPTPIVFERRDPKDGGGWQMTRPLGVAANPSMVETLAYNLKELARKPESAPLEGNPAGYGLAPPERVVRLWGKPTDAPIATLEVGRVSLNRRFVRASGVESVEVVDAKALDLLKLPETSWRDRELFRVPSFEVDAISLKSTKHELKLRRDRDAWHVVEPIRLLASEPRVDALIADLGSIRVLDDSRFVADNVPEAQLDRFGLKNPTMTITLDAGRVDRRRPSQVLYLGKAVEGKEGQLVYARRGGQDDVVAIETRILKGLTPDPNAFRAPKIADINRARVLRIGVEIPGEGSSEVLRVGNDWTMTKPRGVGADRPAILDFLKNLDQLQTSSYLDPKQAEGIETGLENPSMVLKVWQGADPRDPYSIGSDDPNGDLALALQVGRRDLARKALYARLVGDPMILVLPDSAADLLPKNSLAFRDRRVLGLSTEQVERLTFAGTGRTPVVLNAPALKLDSLINAPVGWWMVKPIMAPADGQSVGRLMKLLANLRAESLVAEKATDLGKLGLDSPILKVTWSSFPDSPMLPPPRDAGPLAVEDHSLLIGGSVPGKPTLRYAKLDDRPMIFTVGPETLAMLDAEWHDRRVLAFDPKAVETVRIDWPGPGRSLALALDPAGRRWSFDASEDAPGFDPKPVPALLEAISKLTTGRFVQYEGKIPPAAGLQPGRFAIRLGLEGGSTPKALRIGARASPGQVYATSSLDDQGPVFLVPESPFKPWLAAPRRHDDLPENVFEP